MSKYLAIAITFIVLMAFPLLSSYYATQTLPTSSKLALRPVHNGRPMIPVPPGPKAESPAKATLCPLPNAQCQGSYNWGGYVVVGSTGSVTSVVGNWTVPSLTGDNAAGGNRTTGGPCADTDVSWYDASVWIGIDGFTSGTVEQTGTSSDCYYGITYYYAWYEFYPAGSVTAFYVNPGDHIEAIVTYSATSATCCFATYLKDRTTGRVSYVSGMNVASASENSAEWISESAATGLGTGVLVLLDLSNFGSDTFTNAAATIMGSTGSISSFSPNDYWVGMINMNYPYTPFMKAQPLALKSAGKTFTTKFVSAGP